MQQSQYYEEKLYPLQDGILSAVKSCKTPFYLTGGTALSRAYYHHRHSDDLDFFVNSDPNFQSYVRNILSRLSQAGFTWDFERDLLNSESFVSLLLHDPAGSTSLKLDFVNDTAPRYGDYEALPLFSRIDNVRNILSNKLGAVFRFAGKDIADIREIALHEQFDWSELIIEARNKDIGIEASAIGEIIASVPRAAFDSIVWRSPAPAWQIFKADAERIAHDLVACKPNSLARICP